MPRPSLALACACALAALATPDARGGFVDQQSLTSDTVLYGSSVGQSFVAQFTRPGRFPDGTFQDGNFFLATAPTFSTAFRVDFYLASLGPGGFLPLTTIGYTVAGTNDLYFDFGRPILISGGSEVLGFLIVSSLDGSAFGLRADDRNPYLRGTAYVGASAGTTPGVVVGVDLMFNEGVGVGPAAVPEPSSLSLLGLGLGLGAVGLARRAHRRAS